MSARPPRRPPPLSLIVPLTPAQARVLAAGTVPPAVLASMRQQAREALRWLDGTHPALTPRKQAS